MYSFKNQHQMTPIKTNFMSKRKKGNTLEWHPKNYWCHDQIIMVKCFISNYWMPNASKLKNEKKTLNTSIGDMTLLSLWKDDDWSKDWYCPSRNDPAAVAPDSKNSLKTKLESLTHWELSEDVNRVISIPWSTWELNRFPLQAFTELYFSVINSTPVSCTLLPPRNLGDCCSPLQAAGELSWEQWSTSSNINLWIRARLREASAGGNQFTLSWRKKNC